MAYDGKTDVLLSLFLVQWLVFDFYLGESIL